MTPLPPRPEPPPPHSIPPQAITPATASARYRRHHAASAVPNRHCGLILHAASRTACAPCSAAIAWARGAHRSRIRARPDHHAPPHCRHASVERSPPSPSPVTSFRPSGLSVCACGSTGGRSGEASDPAGSRSVSLGGEPTAATSPPPTPPPSPPLPLHPRPAPPPASSPCQRRAGRATSSRPCARCQP